MFALMLACSDYNLVKPDDVVGAFDTAGLEESGEALLQIEPEPLQFQDTILGCPLEKEVVTLTNVGTADLVIEDLILGAPFHLDWSEVTLAPDESLEVPVTFEPSQQQLYSTFMVANSNDAWLPQRKVQVLGQASNSATFEEQFNQESYPAIDVLFVVDNSESMMDSINHLRDNFDRMLDSLLVEGVDYQLAVITTDMEDPSQTGKIQGQIVHSGMNTVEAEQRFLEAAAVGASGSPDEKGFAAVKAALTEPLLSGHNAGFLREDAALAVILVSDEDDSSGMPEANFENWLLSLKDDPNQVRLHGFVSLDITFNFFSCVTDEVAGRYISVSANMGGTLEHICADDWAVSMDAISDATLGLTDTFILTTHPDVGSLQVEVDGQSLPSSDWSVSGTMLTLDEAPAMGATVDVRYTSSVCP